MSDLSIEEKIKKLTLKQKKFLKVYFETGNATKASLAAYDTDDPHMASNIGAENVAKLGDVVRYIMNKKGLDVEKMVDTVNGAMEANRIHGTGDNFVEIPDHPTRLKAVEVAERWIGIKPEEDGTKIQNNYFNIISQERDKFDELP